MHIPFSENDQLLDAEGHNFLGHRVRILHWDTPPKDQAPLAQEPNWDNPDVGDRVWLIKVPVPGSKYFCRGPYAVSLRSLIQKLKDVCIFVLQLAESDTRSLPDVAIEQEMSPAELERWKKRKSGRDKRYKVIAPLVLVDGGPTRRDICDILQEDQTDKIKSIAKEGGVAVCTVYNWRNRYLAAGCVTNALLDNFDRCGAPGLPKPQRSSKLGRKTRLCNENLEGRGYVLKEVTDKEGSVDYVDKQKLAAGYSLIGPRTSPRDAYLTCMAMHWATHQIDQLGIVRAVLFPRDERPTFAQFCRWGKGLVEKTVAELVDGIRKSAMKRSSKGGSERDSVAMVGQQSYFDGTKSDVYLCSFQFRLNKLPPMTRLQLKEQYTGLIFGWYFGWNVSKPAAAFLAILHGACPNKAERIFKRFGIRIPENAIPGILSRTILADNGELKSEETTQAEAQFGFGIVYTPPRRGERKGGSESQHNADHAHYDHKLAGTNHGKRPDRGEPHPALNAVWNYEEFVRQYIKYVVHWNTEIEVPHLAPDDFMLQDPPVRPTRINIYEWMTRHGMNRSLKVDYESLRAFSLPRQKAVIRASGVYLVANVGGREMLVPRFRFRSEELAATGIFGELKRTNRTVQTGVHIDDSEPSVVWLPTKSGMMKLTLQGRDSTIASKFTLQEWLYCVEKYLVARDQRANQKDQANADILMSRLDTENSAKADLAQQQKNGEILSISKILRNLNANRHLEMVLLRKQDEEFESDHRKRHEKPEASEEAEAADAIDDIMDQFSVTEDQ